MSPTTAWGRADPARRGLGETYNIRGGQELPNLAVIEEICHGVGAAFAADAPRAIDEAKICSQTRLSSPATSPKVSPKRLFSRA
jgi:hypothetical protein